MSSNPGLPRSNGESFSGIAYLLLAILIQAVVFGVFICSLTVLQWRTLDRWPYLVTEFLTVVMVTFGHITVSRQLAWRIDLLDVLLPFLIGLLECLPMLLLGRVPNDTLWWFICYLGLTNVSFVNLLNVRLKTPSTVSLPLVRRRTIFTIVHPFLLLLAIVGCYFEWHVELLGALFMVEQTGFAVHLCLHDLRTRHGSPQATGHVQQGKD